VKFFRLDDGAEDSAAPDQSDQRVETTQIAPTILKVLGLSPDELGAVRKEGTEVLPDLR